MKQSQSDPFALSERLSLLAAERGWSLTQLAEEAGLGKGTVRQIIQSPDRSPRNATLRKIADTLDVSIGYLLGTTDDRTGAAATGLDDGHGPDWITAPPRSTVDDAQSGDITLDVPPTDFGGRGGTVAHVNPLAPTKSGDLVVIRHRDHGAMLAYVAEPYLIYQIPGRGLQHALRGDRVRVMGKVMSITVPIAD